MHRRSHALRVMKLAQLGPARRAPGAWGGAKLSGGNGQLGPHLLNRA